MSDYINADCKMVPNYNYMNNVGCQYDYMGKRSVSTFDYTSEDRKITAKVESNHVACVGAGMIIGAVAGIYIYKKYFMGK
jgi:hypothetical protein